MNGFIKVFEQIGYRHNWMQVFDDFLDITICAFGMGRYEDYYHSVLNRYDEKEQKMFANLLYEMIKAYEEGSDVDGSWVDVLGDFYMEFGSRKGHQNLGQFFTPPTICDMMARLTMNGPLQNGAMVNDCACGSGRTLLAAARMFPENRFGFFVGQDLDHKVCKMAVINFVMYGLRGIIIHMDTLAMKIFNGYRIHLTETGLGVLKLSADECYNYLLTTNTVEEKVESTEPVIVIPKAPKVLKQLVLDF